MTSPGPRLGPREIDPSGGPEYQEPTWQEARDLLAADIESKADLVTRSPNEQMHAPISPWRILAVQDDRLLLVEVGHAADGDRRSVVVDPASRMLVTGGTLHDVLAEGYWEASSGGSPHDEAVVDWLLTNMPAPSQDWDSWLDAAMAQPQNPADCPVPLPPPTTHRPPRWG